MQYITTDEELAEFVDRSLGCPVLAIDTEFLRENTYRPKLCLLQLGNEQEIALIDPFEVSGLEVLAPLFQDERTMKIVHSGRQDIEILHREVGCMPWPLFDTQVAGSLLGYPEQIGYGPLVHSECGVTLDKLDSFTDWSRRPLSESQLSYAANDVLYLPQIYRNMRRRLEQSKRLSWLDGDFRELVNPERYSTNSRERFRKLKRGSQLSRKQLSAAREVAAWREDRAEAIDIPRKWVLSDEQIVEACKRECRTIDQLFMIRGMREKLGTADARRVAKLICTGLDAPREDWPKLPGKTRSERNVDVELDLMNALVRVRARENDIAYHTLARHDALQEIARGHIEGNELMEGWRYDIVGRELVDLVQGRLTLSIQGGRLVVQRSGETVDSAANMS